MAQKPDIVAVHHFANLFQSSELMDSNNDGQHADDIREALLYLMKRMEYRDIRIHQIAEQAGVSRNTFYRSYKNKDQVVLAIYDEAMSGFLEYTGTEIEEAALSNEPKEDIVFQVVLLIFSGVYANLETGRLLFRSNIDDLIYSRFSLFFTRLCGQIIRIRNLHVKQDKLIQFLLSHLSGSAFHFMKEWTLHDNPPEPEEMARLYSRILKPSLDLLAELSE